MSSPTLCLTDSGPLLGSTFPSDPTWKSLSTILLPRLILCGLARRKTGQSLCWIERLPSRSLLDVAGSISTAYPVPWIYTTPEYQTLSTRRLSVRPSNHVRTSLDKYPEDLKWAVWIQPITDSGSRGCREGLQPPGYEDLIHT